ncbi:hypothetical protein EYC84_005444 [Monilinia fructicola]|uniref:Uncharacterized protein n=1 Tax=Monilinia fructicola TaxID=38448 RepID=A0A5M9K0D2_MONFR|nr:hypothetical protein EYC84_005444 [Monilinia fructicola]
MKITFANTASRDPFLGNVIQHDLLSNETQFAGRRSTTDDGKRVDICPNISLFRGNSGPSENLSPLLLLSDFDVFHTHTHSHSHSHRITKSLQSAPFRPLIHQNHIHNIHSFYNIIHSFAFVSERRAYSIYFHPAPFINLNFTSPQPQAQPSRHPS